MANGHPHQGVPRGGRTDEGAVTQASGAFSHEAPEEGWRVLLSLVFSVGFEPFCPFCKLSHWAYRLSVREPDKARGGPGYPFYRQVGRG